MKTTRRMRVPLSPESVTIAFVVVGLLTMASCSSTTVVDFACASEVNEGLLLTIDVVQIDDSEMQQVRQLASDWFSSDLRRQLEFRTKTITVRGNCAERVEFAAKKGFDVLAVIADYYSAAEDPTDTYMKFLSKKEIGRGIKVMFWKGDKLEIRVEEDQLAVQGQG